MSDPYKVLGVPTTATDDEVKAAYRKLAKKYHPDANPNDRVAEQRMKEINAAYDQIMNKDQAPRQDSYGGYGGYSSYGNYGGYGGYGGYGQREQEGDPRLRAAYNYLAYRRYREALNVLAAIQERDARWYYYSAVANSGLGNTAAALEHARRAAEMEPDNEEYAELAARIENPTAYSSPFGGFGGFGGANVSYCGGSRLCLGFIAAQFFCLYMRFCCR